MTSSFNIKILLLLGCLCLLPECLSFEIKLKPSNQEKVIKSLGTNLVFTCEVVGSVDGNLRIQWIDQNKREVLENTGTTGSVRVYIEKDGPRVRKLYVTKIETKDAGKYSCMAQVDNQHKERSFDLVLYKDITFDETSLYQHPPIFKDSIIKCVVSGEPTPVVSWKFNDTVAIGNEGRGRFFPDKKGLLVKNITQADNGFYTCRAEVETDGRYDERRILVIVHVPPKVIKSIGQVNGTEGDATIITCNATGFPQPVFTFYKDDKILEDAPERLKIESKTGTVTFNNLLKIDEGQYSCKAWNDVGESVGRGSLKVFVTPKIYEYKNITKNEQDVGVLTCKSQGDPYPVMSFRKEGMREDLKMGSNDAGRISVTQKSQGHLELVIRKLIHSDRSVYYCLSKNNVGSDEATGFLDVQYKPRFAWDQINESHSWLGRVHNITCSVKANPSAIIQWVRYDRVLENNDTYRIFTMADNSSLQIRVKDGDKNWIYGEYHCLAKNSKGENKQTINLLKADVPEKPKVSVVESTANTLTLRLSPPIDNGGMEIIGYRVEHDNIAYDYSTDDNAWNKQHANRSVADVKIENLKPKTKYRFRIMAKNEVGVGPSIEFNATTTDKSKPFPIHINSPELGSNSYQYKLTWEKPKTGGYPIKEYEIKFRKATVQTNPGVAPIPEDEDESGSWMILTHADDPQEPTLSHVITGLDPLTAYEVVIHAHNQLGRSDAEPTFKFSTNEVTEVDLILASRNSVGIGLVLLTTISIFLLILIVVDISCYFLNGCGMTMFVCVRFCDRANPNSKKRHQQLQTSVESTHCNVQTSPSFIEENCEMTTRSNIPGAPEFNPRELSNSMPLGPKPDRRSVLSQGDERWKDVVEELEKELKNKLFERKQTEPSRSKELVKRLSVLEKQSNHGTNESGFVSEKATPEGMLTIDTSSLIGTVSKPETEDEDSKGIENLISIKDDDDKSVEIKLVDLSDDDDGIKDNNLVLAELEPSKDLNNPCEKPLIDVDNSKFQTPNTTAPKQEMFSKKVSFDDSKIIIVGKME